MKIPKHLLIVFSMLGCSSSAALAGPWDVDSPSASGLMGGLIVIFMIVPYSLTPGAASCRWLVLVQIPFIFLTLVASFIKCRRLPTFRRTGIVMIAYLVATGLSNIGVMAQCSEG